MKDKSLVEVQSVRKRTLALAGLKRISKADADFIVARLDEVEARIIRMNEKPDGEERKLW